MIVAVDFDGTIVKHAYPLIGGEIPGAFEWLARFQEAGARLILWTMRSGQTLDEAVRYCRAMGVEFWGVNVNPGQAETGWSTSPKAYAHLYVDDAALGCPLVRPPIGRPFVDWSIAGPAALAALG